MNCSKCGTSNDPQTKFCSNCGNAMTIDNGSQTENNMSQQTQINQNSVVQQIESTPSVSTVEGKSKDNKDKNKKIIIIVVSVLVIALVLFLVYKLFFNKNKNNEDFNINYSTSFFLKNNDDKYALFNDDGKQLTDFIYSSYSDFINGSAIVKDSDKNVGIISTKGKMTVDFGTYEKISSSAGLYKACREDYRCFLINGDGKVLYDLKDVSVDTFIGADLYSIISSDKEYSILNYAGTKMVSFPKIEDVDDPDTNEVDGFVSVFYNNKNYILNAKTGKEVTSFNSDKHFCVNTVKENGDVITLNSCVSFFESQDVVYYKLIKKGKIIDLDNECDSIYFSDDQLMCKKDNESYLLDNNNKRGIEIYGKAYFDNNTYVTNKNGSSEGVDFYKNGKVVKNVACRTLKETGYMSSNLYILGTYYSSSCGTTSGTYEYYNADGDKVFDKSFTSVEEFDENGLAKVSELKGDYYLINVKGTQISDTYSDIYLSNDYYVVTKDDKKGLINKEGKVIIPCEYSRVELEKKQDKLYVLLTTNDSKYAVYNLETNKEIITFDKKPSLYNNYISLTENNKTRYYTYTGKMFYEL